MFGNWLLRRGRCPGARQCAHFLIKSVENTRTSSCPASTNDERLAALREIEEQATTDVAIFECARIKTSLARCSAAGCGITDDQVRKIQRLFTDHCRTAGDRIGLSLFREGWRLRFTTPTASRLDLTELIGSRVQSDSGCARSLL